MMQLAGRRFGTSLMRDHWLAYVAMVFGTICISTSGIFVKLAHVPGPVAGLYRTGIALLLMAIPFALHARRVIWSPRMVLAGLIGGVFFACDLAFWNTSLLHTSVANAVLFGNTAPIWVSLGAIILFKERLRRGFWVGLLLAFLGAALIGAVDAAHSATLGFGNLLAMIAAVFYAGYMLFTQRARVRLDSLSYFWLAALGSVLTLLAVTVILRQPLAVPAVSLPPLLGLAIVTHTCGWLALNYALGHLPASLVAPTLLGQPVLAAVLAIPILREGLSWVQIGGGAVVLLGIYLVHRARG